MLVSAPGLQQREASAAGNQSVADSTIDDGSGASSASGSDQAAKKKKSKCDNQVPPIATKRARPAQTRIPTYYVRKEEKTTLELQVQLLQAQLEYLKRNNQTRSSHSSLRSLNNDRSLLLRRLENNAMLDAVQTHQFSFARAQSAFGKHVSTHHQLPFESYIRLGKDWSERDATLLAMRDNKFEVSKQYLAERTRYLDPSVSFTENTRFTTPEGDLSTLHFNVVPFDGITSVKQVFDALLFYFFNIEISVSEILGDITIREDDGIRLQGISQNRLISSVHGDIQVETNTVMFCKLFEASEAVRGGGGEIGVIVADSVNEDELYPYSPETRLRNDVTAAITVSLQPRQKINRLTGEAEEELVVVMVRTCLLRLRRTDLPVPAHEMEGFRENFERWSDAMLKVVREILYPKPHPVCSSGTASTHVPDIVGT